jgi:IclR family pca regulon transcriptional regulator
VVADLTPNKLNLRHAQTSAATQGLAMPDKDFVIALHKGLDTLTCFSRVHSRLTLSEVARLTGCTPASARRSLRTLWHLGYLECDGKHYWMNHKCLLVANAYLASRPLPSLAQPLLDGLSERTRESASLAKLLDGEALIIARSTARRSLSVGLGIGSRLPAYCSALGRVLLASLPRGEVRARVRQMTLQALTPRTVTNVSEVIAQVDEARERGFATSDGELEIGVRSMAVPVFNRAGAVVAGLSIAVRADRMRLSEFIEGFLPVLGRARDRLGEQIYQD